MASSRNITKPVAFHPGGYSKLGKFGVESVGFFVAEGVSIATSLGIVGIADLIIPKSAMKYASQVVGRTVVEPMLDAIDTIMPKVCKLEECKMDTSKSREERAEDLAKILLVFSAAYAASMTVKFYTRRMWNDAHGFEENTPAPLSRKEVGTGKWLKHHLALQHVSAHEKMIFAADEGVHYASLYLMNNQLAPLTDSIIRSTSDVIQKTTGADEKKSREVASMWSIWELPNLLGAAAGVATIAGAHYRNWPTGWVGKFLENKPRTDLSHVEMLAERAKKSAMHAAAHTP